MALGTTSEMKVINTIVGIIDLVMIAIAVICAHSFVSDIKPEYEFYFRVRSLVLLAILAYIPAVAFFPPILYRRVVYIDKILERAFKAVLLYIIIYMAILTFLKSAFIPRSFLLSLGIFSWMLVSAERLLLREILKLARKNGKNQKHTILIGKPEFFKDIYHEITNASYGIQICGIFCEKEDAEKESHPFVRLGSFGDAIEYMQEHPNVQMVYCAITEKRQDEIKQILRYCEKSGTRFYALPVYLNMLKKKMVIQPLGNSMVLTERAEPLDNVNNKFLKRAFDLVCSSIFLITLFPVIYLIVAVIIKIQSPGPVLFRQERSGLNGKVFTCLKFRSMHVNKDADRVQATEHDPRKFKFGNFMRKTNIDELPQFINVWLGDMSMVGPRPHMLLHTETYSKLIQEYMVRHWVKPGITGWAQVLGFRGETKELKQMEDRVKADIWYVENWNFWLDIKIMLKTVWNMISRNEKNAY